MVELENFVRPALVIVLVIILAAVTFPFVRENVKNIVGIDPFGKKEEVKVDLPTSLSDEISRLITSDKAFSQSSVEYEIKPDEELIVGFDKSWDNNTRIGDCFNFREAKIPKPKVCGDSACLCKFRDKTGGDDFSEVLSCNKFPGNVVFLAPDNDRDPNEYIDAVSKPAPFALKKQDYKYLVLYGKCGNALSHSRLYLDVHKTKNDQGKDLTYVYISVFRSDSESFRKGLYDGLKS